MKSKIIALIVLLIMPGVALTEDVATGSSMSSRLHLIKPRNPQGLRDLFKYTGESMHFVSAHRGGAQRGFPENCIATFENTLQQTFAIMEIDPRYTKDGAIVVHHDPTLTRTTTGDGRVVDFTLSELKALRLKDTEGAVTDYRIPTLDEVLQWARGKTILVLDQKDVPVEARIRKIEEHHAEAYAMLIVYSFEDAGKCYKLNKNIMMEVMIPNREKFRAFDKTGVPWSNIIAFVGHTPPNDKELLRMIHAKGTCCMEGTSRNLDRELVAAGASGAAAIEQHYRELLQQGADVIETDIPGKVGKLLYSESAIPSSKSSFLSVFSVPASAAGGVVPGIQELYRLDQLPVLKESIKVASISSYDRTGGNNDGFGGQYSFVRKEKGGLVLADLKGPGVIYRISTPTPTDDMLEFYFDGESEPSIKVKFRDLFMGKHPAFVRPLVGYGAGGFYSYVPLTYAKSCKVFLRAERARFYQINYARYPDRTPIVSFPKLPADEYKRHLEKAVRLFESSGSDISSYAVPAGGTTERFSTKVRLKPGETANIFKSERPGRIVGIHISPAGALADKDRGITLRAYWDDDNAPAILSPAGDFFGYAWGEPATKSLLLGTNNGTSYCYFPMPFDKSARVELSSEQRSGREIEVEAEVLFVPIGRRENEGKFYALWRLENPTTKGKPFTFVQTEGRGHIVGVIQQSQGFVSGVTPFFEGDDQTTIDGELVIHGTGSEDFYNGGWYDVAGRWDSRRSFPLSGCLGYQKHLGRTGGYRLFLGDAYAYRKSILQTIEHAPTGNSIQNDYCAVTFLYSQERPTCEFTLPPVEQRKVIDLKRIVFATWWNIPIHSFSYRNATLTKAGEKLDGRNVRFLSMQAKDGDSFGHHFICFVCELPAAGKYKVSLDTVKGPSQAIVQVFVDEAPAGPEVDLYAPKRERSEEHICTLDLAEGPNNLLIKLVGKNAQSQGLGLDLINIICERLD